MSTAAAGSAAAAAAAAAELARQQEEEEMTSYYPGELADGWEFKILRSMKAAFKHPDRMRAILAEEGQAGWVLVEKFDDSRLRLRRPATAAANDASLTFDPYRTYYGPTETQYTLTVLAWVFGIIIGVVLVIAGIAAALSN